MGRVSRAAASGFHERFSLRNALEPPGQSVERSAVHGCGGTREGQTGSRIRVSAGRGGIYVEYPTEGFVAAGCPVRYRTFWRAVDGGTWRTPPPDCAASLRVEKREIGARGHA